MGYTKRPAFIQLFQIILILATIALQGYALYVDYKWNHEIHPKNPRPNYRPCLELTKLMERGAYDKLANSSLEELKLKGNEKVLASTTFRKGRTVTSDAKLFREHMNRDSVMEKAALILTGSSLILLVSHLVLACVSSNYEYQTKWAAAVQGTVMFLLGFAGVLIPISAYDFDTEYSILSSKFKECRILRLCVDKKFKTANAFIHFAESNGFDTTKWPNQEVMVEAFSKKTPACQMIQMKIVAASLCGLIVILCVLIIGGAMELTTIYNEEDVDEEERDRRTAFHHINTIIYSSKRRVKDNRSSTSSLNSNAFATHGKHVRVRISLLHMSKRL